jgi:hypothetical protein
MYLPRIRCNLWTLSQTETNLKGTAAEILDQVSLQSNPQLTECTHFDPVWAEKIQQCSFCRQLTLAGLEIALPSNLCRWLGK